jgi:hypothetical protein
MTKREKKLRDLRNRIARLEAQREAAIRTLVKAEITLPGMRKQAKRLNDALLSHQTAISRLSVGGARPGEDEEQTRREVEAEVQAAEALEDLEIPDYLKRSPLAPEVAAAAYAVANNHNKPATPEAKKLVATEKRKVREEHKRALLTGQKRKAPLTGRAAEAFLRGR